MTPSKLCGLILSGVLAASPVSAGSFKCDAVQAAVAKNSNWRRVDVGVEILQIQFDWDVLDDVSLIKFDPNLFRVRTFDMRDVVAGNKNRGYYAAPFFSLRELRRILPGATVLASAGMTRSFSEPQPAGFLKIDGSTRNRVASKDSILDGVVCIDAEGRFSILSELENGRRRSPPSAESCYSGFQAGPVVVADRMPTVGEHKHRGARVVLGTIERNVAILAFSTKATTASIGCVLTTPALKVDTAIALQGDQLGGAIVTSSPRDASGIDVFGNIEATIASALVIEGRRQVTAPEPRRLNRPRSLN